MQSTLPETIFPVQVILYGGVITTFNWQRALWLLREMPAREACCCSPSESDSRFLW